KKSEVLADGTSRATRDAISRAPSRRHERPVLEAAGEASLDGPISRRLDECRQTRIGWGCAEAARPGNEADNQDQNRCGPKPDRGGPPPARGERDAIGERSVEHDKRPRVSATTARQPAQGDVGTT